jgi:hypothetical protein
MLDKTQKYLNEALECDTILLATCLCPCYRLSIFTHWFPGHLKRVKRLLLAEISERKAQIDGRSNPHMGSESQGEHPGEGTQEVFDFFPRAYEETPSKDEMDMYFEGKHPLPPSQAINCLAWWKVSSFPCVAKLIRSNGTQLTANFDL